MLACMNLLKAGLSPAALTGLRQYWTERKSKGEVERVVLASLGMVHAGGAGRSSQ